MLPPLKRRLLHLALACAPLALPPLVSAQPAAEPIVGDSARPFRTTVEQDNLWDIAGMVARQAGVSRQQAMVAVLRRNPDAFVKGNIHRLRRGVPLTMPSLGELRAEDRAASVALVEAHLKLMRSGGELPALPALGPVVAAPSVPVAPPVLPVPPASAVVPAPVKPVPAPVPVPVPAPVPASAVAAAPVPASAPEAAPAPAPVASAPAVAAVEASASAVDAVPAASGPTLRPAADAAAEPGTPTDGGAALRWLPWLLGAGALAGGLILWRRRAGVTPEGEALPTVMPQETAPRPSAPRSLDVSTAAADMARTVEASPLVTELVRVQPDETDATEAAAPASSPAGFDDPDLRGGLRVEMARTCLELGREADARALLQAVLREDAGRHQAVAAEILARMG